MAIPSYNCRREKEKGLEDERKQGGLQIDRQASLNRSYLILQSWLDTKVARCVGEVMAPRTRATIHILARCRHRLRRRRCSCLATFVELPPRRIDLQGRKAPATCRISTNPLTLKATNFTKKLRAIGEMS